MENLERQNEKIDLTPEQIKEKFGYKFVPVFDEHGFAWAFDGEKEFRICRDGTKAFPQFKNFSNFDSLGFATAQKQDGKWIFINDMGEQVIPGEFQNARGFANGVAMVVVDNKYFHIKPDGTPLYPGKYYFATEAQLENGNIKVLEGRKVHTINLKGEIISTEPVKGSWESYVIEE